MSVGAFLDDAAQMLASSVTRLRALEPDDTYSVAAALQARDHVYRELGRFITVLRPQDRISIAATDELQAVFTSGDPRTIVTMPAIGAAVASAAISYHDAPRYPLRAPGSAAAALMQAADSIAMALETVNTHLGPSPNDTTAHSGLHRQNLSG